MLIPNLNLVSGSDLAGIYVGILKNHTSKINLVSGSNLVNSVPN
jgi:hypothetical protein